MVLRGAQFQRSGPAGCTFLTRRALSSYTATFLQGRSDAICLKSQGADCAQMSQTDSTGRFGVGNLTKDSRHMARECDVCHGDLGEL